MKTNKKPEIKNAVMKFVESRIKRNKKKILVKKIKKLVGKKSKMCSYCKRYYLRCDYCHSPFVTCCNMKNNEDNWSSYSTDESYQSDQPDQRDQLDQPDQSDKIVTSRQLDDIVRSCNCGKITNANRIPKKNGPTYIHNLSIRRIIDDDFCILCSNMCRTWPNEARMKLDLN